MSATGQNDDWMCHGWDDHIIGQLEHGRSLTFRQRLEWLEEMSEMLARLRRNPDWARRNAIVEGREPDRNAPLDPRAKKTL